MGITFNYSKLRGKIMEKYRSYRDFANEISISPKALGDKLSGKYPFKQEEMQKIKDVLALSSIDEYFFCA